MTLFTPAVYVEGVSEALATLRNQPLRAALAGLAMAAAVTTTAVVQTGLNGLARSAREAGARAFGSDSFVLARVAAGTLSRRELADRITRNPNITRSDVRFLEGVAQSRLVYAATAQGSSDVTAGSRRFENAAINGTQAALFEIRDVGIARGRAFTEDEVTRGAQVVVVGYAVADELFPATDPLGQAVRIAGRAFRIVGIQAEQGSSGGVSLDRYVWMPITAFERAFGAPASLQVFARAADISRTAARPPPPHGGGGCLGPSPPPPHAATSVRRLRTRSTSSPLTRRAASSPR
jgi:putative ABC transport system permease protein